MFEQGMTLAEVVIATRQPPQEVGDLYRDWATSLEAGERQPRQNEIDRRERDWRAGL